MCVRETAGSANPPPRVNGARLNPTASIGGNRPSFDVSAVFPPQTGRPALRILAEEEPVIRSGRKTSSPGKTHHRCRRKRRERVP